MPYKDSEAKKAYQVEYNARPEVKVRAAELRARPEAKARALELRQTLESKSLAAARERTPEVKARRLEKRSTPEAKAKVKARVAEWNQRQEVKVRQAERRARPEAKAWMAEYRLRPEVKELYAERRSANIGSIRAYYRKRYAADTQYRMATLLRSRLTSALKRKSKRGSAVALLGCTIEELITRFESLFTDGMSWENQSKWHVDHVRPLSSFDLEDLNQLAEACHFTNLQPLWSKDNLRKYNKREE